LENLIINGILKLEKLEKEHGKMGTIIALLIIVITTIVAAYLIGTILIHWLEICNWALETFTGWRLK
jgi:hypothetical protein